MMLRRHPVALAVLSIALTSVAVSAEVQPTAQSATTGRATGSFDVKITQQQDNTDPAIARHVIDKQFHGSLEGTSKGEMLSTGGSKGTGGYVAIEIVTGTLNGRTGSFALQHIGSMVDNSFSITVEVVPGSGTGQLAGIAGKMDIHIAPDGKHTYDFEYTLPAQK